MEMRLGSELKTLKAGSGRDGMDHTSNNRVHHKSGINNVFPATLQITAQFRVVPATADPRQWGGW